MNHPWFGDRPFRMTSAFSTALFLDRYLRGEGGHWLDWTKRFIERKRRQGVVGGRVFVQTCDWRRGTHPFFEQRGSSYKAATPWGFESRMWDYGALVRGERPTRLTAHSQMYFLTLVKLAREFEWKWEASQDATLKHTPGVGWRVIGHCIRQGNHFLGNIHRGNWDAETMGAPDLEVNGRIRQLFEEVKGPIDTLIAVETHNEWDAHSKDSWDRDGMSRTLALNEVNRQLERMGRYKDGRPEQWPEGAIFVSHGGNDNIEYDPRHASAVAIHPSRPSTRCQDRFNHLKKYGKPIYANEIIHYIDPSMWEKTIPAYFGRNSSTKDTDDWIRFVDELLAAGIWVCEHSLVGMANGMWLDNTWTEMPLDAAELARGGSSPSPSPSPGPSPTPTPPSPGPAPKRYRFGRIIEQAYREVLDRDPDPAGLENYDKRMREGMSEAQVRESLIRSKEYADKNPE